jgi:hypothetical protein
MAFCSLKIGQTFTPVSTLRLSRTYYITKFFNLEVVIYGIVVLKNPGRPLPISALRQSHRVYFDTNSLIWELS